MSAHIAPGMLKIDGGKVTLKIKGGPATDYLKDWQRQDKIPDGTEECLLTRDHLQRLMDNQNLNGCA